MEELEQCRAPDRLGLRDEMVRQKQAPPQVGAAPHCHQRVHLPEKMTPNWHVAAGQDPGHCTTQLQNAFSAGAHYVASQPRLPGQQSPLSAHSSRRSPVHQLSKDPKK
eukprot:TRINITY_DN1760_c1_g1_i2.p2 TRINITY_DN1760_c1_g1~~TRINITY_DN1760_c1_g1_i2.p2  ORF type:complete len:108 (-),score=23.30 TRINITY_DN1760_c1_g1_i2:668-991(-)